jgi:HSP20 family protein
MATLVIRRPSLLDEFERMAGIVPLDGGLSMAMDVFAEKDELVVRAEMPGVEKEKIEINIDKDSLRIEAEKSGEEKTDERTYYLCERCSGKFIRSLSLPFPVDASKASASFENGVLEIRLPKAEEAKSRHIEVR